MIDLINSGIDMFDSTLPYLTTERNSALIFDYDLKYKWDSLFRLYVFVYLQLVLILITFICRNECVVMDIPHCESDESIDKLNNYEICLKDKR